MIPQDICIIGYLSLINLFAFQAFRTDKLRAKKRGPRIPENRLLLLTALGGAGGALLAMRRLHHKTRHIRFRILVPLFLVMWLILVGAWLSLRLNG